MGNQTPRTLWSPSPEDDGINGHALLALPLGVDDGALGGRGAEPGVGMGTQGGAS